MNCHATAPNTSPPNYSTTSPHPDKTPISVGRDALLADAVDKVIARLDRLQHHPPPAVDDGLGIGL